MEIEKFHIGDIVHTITADEYGRILTKEVLEDEENRSNKYPSEYLENGGIIWNDWKSGEYRSKNLLTKQIEVYEPIYGETYLEAYGDEEDPDVWECNKLIGFRIKAKEDTEESLKTVVKYIVCRNEVFMDIDAFLNRVYHGSKVGITLKFNEQYASEKINYATDRMREYDDYEEAKKFLSYFKSFVAKFDGPCYKVAIVEYFLVKEKRFGGKFKQELINGTLLPDEKWINDGLAEIRQAERESWCDDFD